MHITLDLNSASVGNQECGSGPGGGHQRSERIGHEYEAQREEVHHLRFRDAEEAVNSATTSKIWCHRQDN